MQHLNSFKKICYIKTLGICIIIQEAEIHAHDIPSLEYNYTYMYIFLYKINVNEEACMQFKCNAVYLVCLLPPACPQSHCGGLWE